jgi:hypothetical protein
MITLGILCWFIYFVTCSLYGFFKKDAELVVCMLVGALGYISILFMIGMFIGWFLENVWLLLVGAVNAIEGAKNKFHTKPIVPVIETIQNVEVGVDYRTAAKCNECGK